MSFFRGFIGIVFILFVAFLFSNNRKHISWKVIIYGIAFQLIIAYSVLNVSVVHNSFVYISRIFILIMDFSLKGSEFVFGSLVHSNSFGYIFAFQVLPTIIFFSALTSLLFYLGVIQKVVYGLAWLFCKTLKLSGAESLSVAANIFLGQVESPLMIKEYLGKMNRSEMMLVMTGGMATIAGGVMAAYIGFLGGDDPVLRLFYAKHLLTASVMSAPGAIIISKIFFPQTSGISKEIKISKEKVGNNILEAISNGTMQGLKLAVGVGAMVLVFIALVTMVNYLLCDIIGAKTGLNALVAQLTNGKWDAFSLQFILGYILSPIMWVLGVCYEDMTLVGRLLGEKIIMNEFIAYISLSEIKNTMGFYSEKSLLFATYMLCGFANLGSIGIQLGGIGILAPSKKNELSKLAFKALIAGALASLMTATIVLMIS